MTVYWVFLFLLSAHWVADFVLQTHWQASNKSRNNGALLRHVGVYTAVLAAASGVLITTSGMLVWATFVLLNGVLHFATDYVTSRWTSRLWAKQDWHNFFVVVGLDQLIHQVALAVTLYFAWFA